MLPIPNRARPAGIDVCGEATRVAACARYSSTVSSTTPAASWPPTTNTLDDAPRNAVATIRKLIRGDPGELLARIDLEAQEFNKALHSSEAREVFMAFLAKGKK